MNPEKANGLSPALQTALQPLLAGIEVLSEQIREYNGPTRQRVNQVVPWRLVAYGKTAVA
jgi:hypothetical protein